jgi:hypothetical protein
MKTEGHTSVDELDHYLALDFPGFEVPHRLGCLAQRKDPPEARLDVARFDDLRELLQIGGGLLGGECLQRLVAQGTDSDGS